MNILKVTNPWNNEVLANLTKTNEQELFRLIEEASSGQKLWAKKSLYERSHILYHFIDVLTAHTNELVLLESKEMAKPYSMCMDEVSKVPQNIRGTIEYANHMYGQVMPDNDSDAVNDLVFTQRVPLGVIGCVIPFNYPIELTLLKVIPALVMGNAVIVKAPSSNPMAVLRLGELLHEAGIPKEISPFLVCDREVCTNAVIKNPKVNALALTGSTSAGIKLAEDSAKCLKPLFLELGGNDPFIICDDANLDDAVQEIMDGRFYIAGQTCCAPKRLIVARPVYNKVVQKLIKRLRKVIIGDPIDPKTEISALVSEKAAITVEQQVARTVEQGAVIAYGGKRDGAFYEPTVLTGVTKNMDVAKDMEIFGPVFTFIAFDTIEEALEIANQSCYALNSGVMSKDIMKAFHIAKQLEAGCSVINGHSAYRHIDQAHGGGKMTGLGREGISVSLEEFSQIKNYVLKGAWK